VPTSEIDKTILSLPEIAKNMAKLQNNDQDRQGWNYLAQMFERWLGNPARDGEKEGYSDNYFFISWDWLYRSQRVKDAVNYLKIYALNYNGKQALANYLKKVFGEGQSPNRTFQYSDNQKDWNIQYVNYASIPGFFISDIFNVSGETAALGAFSLRVLPKGTIETLENGNKRITVTGIAVYAEDNFQFEGNYNLRFWSYIDKKYRQYLNNRELYNQNYSPVLEANYSDVRKYIELNNYNFRDFRMNYNKGEDFKIRSHKYMTVDDFNPISFDVDLNWNPVKNE